MTASRAHRRAIPAAVLAAAVLVTALACSPSMDPTGVDVLEGPLSGDAGQDCSLAWTDSFQRCIADSGCVGGDCDAAVERCSAVASEAVRDCR
jgi:hypothetical protein